MSLMHIICAYCGCGSMKLTGGVNRSIRKGVPLYCNRQCAGLARRDLNPLTPAEKRAAKSEYDRRRRAKLGEALLAKKRAAYHAKIAADPIGMRALEREQRQRRMSSHVEYCRRPEYRKWKAEYDRKYLAQKQFGPFAEAALVLREIEAEIAARSTFTERAIAKGTLNKRTQRRRDYERQTDRR